MNTRASMPNPKREAAQALLADGVPAMSRNSARSTVVPGPWPPAGAEPPKGKPERRAQTPADLAELRTTLTPAQQTTLEAMEIFRWRLAFVRRPMFMAPIPVLFDADNTRFVVIQDDGSLDEHPTLKLRN